MVSSLLLKYLSVCVLAGIICGFDKILSNDRLTIR
jgi:hypothetical protein